MRNRIEPASREKDKTEQFESEMECRHYWLIESPNGPSSRGVCKFCGMEREFLNARPEFLFGKRDDDKPETTGKSGNKTGKKKDPAYTMSK